MELSKAIRTGYYTALNGNISAPVYDVYAIPEGVKYPYVLLSSQTSIQGNLKRCKKYDATILLDIVTGSTDPIGREQSENIAEEIENIINPDSFADIDLSSNGYSIGNTTRGSDYDMGDKNGAYYVFRKLIRYEHLISKL